jgi:hypothetical protein
VGNVARNGGGSCSWGTATLVGAPIAFGTLALVFLVGYSDLPRLVALVLVDVVSICMGIAVVVIGNRLDRRQVTLRSLLPWILMFAIVGVILAGLGAVFAGL